jgi:hypothetical protein
MKTVINFFYIFSLFNCFSISAAVLTVSNNPQIPAQYSNAQEAYIAAQNGDELYLHPGGLEYQLHMNLNKKVNITGPGFFNNLQSTVFSRIKISFTNNFSSTTFDNIYIQGVCLTQISSFGSFQNEISDLTFFRCMIDAPSFSPVQNFSIIQSVVVTNSINNANIANSLVFVNSSNGFENNIFNNCNIIFNTTFSQFSGNTTYNNCIITHTGTNSNLIMTGFPVSPGFLFNRCIFYNYGNLPSFPHTNFDCLLENPIFIQDFSGTSINGNTSIQNILSYINGTDLRLQPNSPGINSGSDGSDIGITGGAFAFFNLKEQGLVRIPYIQNISVEHVPGQNNQLNIQFQATKRD